MWGFLGKLVSRSKGLSAVFGEVVFKTPQEHGVYSRSFFEWRVKRAMDSRHTYIAVAMRPDAYAGLEGAATNYIHFDVDTAVRLRDSLNACIEFARQQPRPIGGPAA